MKNQRAAFSFSCLTLAGSLTLLTPTWAHSQTLLTNADGSVTEIYPTTNVQRSAGSQMQMKSPSGVIAGTEPTSNEPLPAGQTDSLAPDVLSSVEGIDFDGDHSLNTPYYHIPPDPIGAVGSNYLVSVVNTSIEWHTKAGVQENSQRLGKVSTASGSFFESLSPVNMLFDPKVIYDQFEGRFLVVALEQQDTADGDSTNDSRILLAVSSTDDPNDAWYFAAFASKVDIGGTDTWADYPGIAVDEEAVYLTANMFPYGSSGSSLGTRLWILDKTQFYTNGTPSYAVYDPFASAGIGNGGTLQPALVFGDGGVPSGAGTFFLNSGWTGGSDDFLAVIRVDDPLGSPSFANQFVNLGNVHNNAGGIPDAPQPGTSHLISANDPRMLDAVWRDDNLYAVNTVNPPSGTDSGEATAHWYRISTTNLSSLTLVDQGNVGGEDLATGTYTFFPSIAVDRRGNLGIGFAASGPSLYPGSFYVGRLTNDTAGTVQSASTNAAGVTNYYRAFGGTDNRWGDYSGIALDPSTELDFWIFNQYALSHGSILGSHPTEDGRWGTRWGSFRFNTNPTTTDDTISRSGTNAVKVSKTTLLSNDSDSDGDAVSFDSTSGTSTNGGSIAVSGNWIYYTPPSGNTDPDAFTYTITDGYGGTQTGTVLITLPVDNSQTPNNSIAINGSEVRVTFHGIPGRGYDVQYATNLSSPNWTYLDSLTANSLGIFEYVDTNSTPSRFYRSVYP